MHIIFESNKEKCRGRDGKRMKIAVCDDQKECLIYVSDLLKTIKRIENIKEYSNIKQLQLDIEYNETFDIIIMDIDWKQEKNGIDYAHEIYCVSPQTQIIFLTGYNDQYSQSVFLKPTNLAGYVTKPINRVILEANIENAWRRKQEEDSKKLTIIHKNRALSLYNKDIVYIESVGHKAIIHTRNQDYICYEKLNDLKKRMDSYFVECHKSFLVNMEEISRIEKDKMIFFDGREAPISKKKYDDVRKIYFKYIGCFLGEEGIENGNTDPE